MSEPDADDPTVPTAKAGVDPLLAFPTESTGQTGQIERPGDQTPWWFVPGLCAVALFFIGLLATINQDRASDLQDAQRRADAEGGAAADVSDAPGSDAGESATGGSDPEAGAGATVGGTGGAVSTEAEDPRLADLPPEGVVRFAGSEFPIESRCEVQLPFDPADTEYQVSSYFFFDGDGERQLVDRIFDGESESAQLFGDARFVDLAEIGDSGAFVATFDDASATRFELVVNPGTDDDPQCEDRVVTNAPGQFSEPHTRVVLDVCLDRDGGPSAAIVGLTSEGAQFEILQPGGELGEIVFVERGQEPMRTAAPASIIRDGDATSASGVVSRGVNDLDLTIDIGNTFTEADARTCAPSDRL